MTVIQTVAGGAGGGGSETELDLTGELLFDRISWTADSSLSSRYYFSAGTTPRYGIKVSVEPGLIAICPAPRQRSTGLTHRTYASAINDKLDSVLQNTPLANLPDGTYSVRLYGPLMETASGGAGTGINRTVTVSNGNVTCSKFPNNSTYWICSSGSNAVLYLYIMDVKKTS